MSIESPHFGPNWTISKPVQDMLAMRYHDLLAAGRPLPTLADTGFRVFSQNDEDGILHFIFTLIGVSTRTAVEVCCGDGIECNSANLIVNHGWNALLVDGDPERIERGRRFYASCRDTFIWPPVLVRNWITAETVNATIRDSGFEGEIDLLCVDVDGMDWWVWKAVDAVVPRVVVVEYQDILGPDLCVTAPYDANFTATWENGEVNNGGASLSAFVKLGREKGYRLVGVNRYGFNAFFVRSDLGGDFLPERPAATCFSHPKVQDGIRRRGPLASRYKWVEV